MTATAAIGGEVEVRVRERARDAERVVAKRPMGEEGKRIWVVVRAREA